MSLSRRHFLRGFAGVLLVAPPVAAAARRQDAGPPPQESVDALRDPTMIGAPRAPLHPLDNDPTLIGIERKLRCTCGCTLDIYTCRTTDFTCTVSPALHREIRTMFEAGQSPQAIVDFMVDREGPQMLLSHPARGFNLAGYLVPGLTMLVAGLLLAAYLLRKRGTASAALATSAGAADLPSVSASDQARLQRALDEVDS